MRRYLTALLAALLAVPAACGSDAHARAALALASCPSGGGTTCPCTGAASCVCDPDRCACPKCLTEPVKTTTCPCSGTSDCVCDLAGGACRCQNCQSATVQERRWRAQGWRRDGAGNWFRPLTPAEVQSYRPAPVFMPPAFAPMPMPMMGGFGGGFGGGCSGGG